MFGIASAYFVCVSTRLVTSKFSTPGTSSIGFVPHGVPPLHVKVSGNVTVKLKKMVDWMTHRETHRATNMSDNSQSFFA